jgi:tripartite-type tricarboxylate transporter receptor subunit TctC
LALLASAPVVQAQSSGSYPNRPIRLVVGYPPGGSSDATARLLGAALSIKLGQPVIIDNKPGANTAIAAQYAKTQPVFKNPQCHPLEGPTEKGPEKSGRNGAERAHRETRIGLEPA